jgi:hypothetical protein
VAAISLAVSVGCYVLFFSGLALPILDGARNELNEKLKTEFELQLPADAVVEHGITD